MGFKRKIRITVESESVLIVLRRGVPIRAWCERCAAQAEFAAFAGRCGSAPSGVNPLARLIAEGKAHSLESPDGSSLVCLRSILEHLDH